MILSLSYFILISDSDGECLKVNLWYFKFYI